MLQLSPMNKPAFFLLLTAASLVQADVTWNRFRGPNGTGVVETTNLPAKLDEKSVQWQIPLGKGHSSPTIWKNMLVITAETAGGKRAVVALDAASGKQIWSFEQPFNEHLIHKYNSFASSSPYIDEERIYVNWSSGTTIEALALDHTGKMLWHNNHVADYIHEHGTGISPVVADGIMIVRSEFDWQRDGKIYTEDPEQKKWKACIVGLDAATGKQVWRNEIPNCLNTFSTPVVRKTKDGKNEFICADTGSGVMGIDTKTGKVNWQHNPGYSKRSLGSGVLSDDFYFCTFGTGGGVTEIAALDLKSGKPEAVPYDIPKGLPYVPSPLVIGERMYLLGDGGILRNVDLKTGKVNYEERVEGVGGSAKFFGSPVAGDGKIYCGSQQGDLIVIKAGDKFEKLSAMKLDSAISASPAVGDQKLYVRTEQSLYCVGAGPQPVP
jgi:outer membrane protein assembly factor BamB